MWRVLLHNDDYTTQEFVVWVLETVFHKAPAEAFSIMMRVHQSGLGIAGIYTRDVAETKVNATKRLAEQQLEEAIRWAGRGTLPDEAIQKVLALRGA